jgi:hypothetical protein
MNYLRNIKPVTLNLTFFDYTDVSLRESWCHGASLIYIPKVLFLLDQQLPKDTQSFHSKPLSVRKPIFLGRALMER